MPRDPILSNYMIYKQQTGPIPIISISLHCPLQYVLINLSINCSIYQNHQPYLQIINDTTLHLYIIAILRLSQKLEPMIIQGTISKRRLFSASQKESLHRRKASAYSLSIEKETECDPFISLAPIENTSFVDLCRQKQEWFDSENTSAQSSQRFEFSQLTTDHLYSEIKEDQHQKNDHEMQTYKSLKLSAHIEKDDSNTRVSIMMQPSTNIRHLIADLIDNSLKEGPFYDRNEDEIDKSSFSSKENHEPSFVYCNQSLNQQNQSNQIEVEYIQSAKRRRFTNQNQPNKRRIHSQIACTFLNIDRFFKLQEIQIKEVLQIHKNQQYQIAVIQGFVQQYSQTLKKRVMQANPRILLAAYHFYGLQQLVRIQKSYGKIYGLITYDDFIDIADFLTQVSTFSSSKSE